MISESRDSSTLILPTTYSVRENGRQKYRGIAPLARSGETRLGPTKAVSRYANAPWTQQKYRKKLASTFETLADGVGMPNELRTDRLCAR